MTPSPILKVLSSMKKSGVSYLLMGGQACVLYGAAEFSRDADLAVLADSDNLRRFEQALDELNAECIAVPPFEPKYLEMGLAVHFRCQHPDAKNIRIDVMSRMRGLDDFPALWERRTTIDVGDETLDLLSLPDLVKAKKTQRDKDWPMITRLVENNYFAHRDSPTDEQIDFWLRELRTERLLIETAARFPDRCERIAQQRRLLLLARAGDEPSLRTALRGEEEMERELDRQYWQPLKEQLQRLRSARRS